MAKIETLVDDFSTQQPHWTNVDQGAEWTGGRLGLALAPPPYVTVNTDAEWDFSDSSVFIHCYPPNADVPMSGGGITYGNQTGMSLWGPDYSYRFFIGLEDTWDGYGLLCRIELNWTNDDTRIWPYDPAAMAYFRLREDSGTVFWETAPEAIGPWTVQRQASRSAAITDMALELVAGNWSGTLRPADIAWFDDLNHIEAPPVIETFTAGQQWALAYAQGERIASLWKAGEQIFEDGTT